MDELKPCPKCGKVPKLETHNADIRGRIYPEAVIRCNCDKAYVVVALTKEEAVKFAKEDWNRRADNG